VTGFWAEVPAGTMANLVGASPEAIALALEPLPAGAPAVLTCRPAADPSSARVVTAVLDRLESAALDLYPAWLPGARTIDGPGGAGASAVRALAAAKAAATPHCGPFLADLAVRAIGGGPAAGRFPAEIRAAGLARVLADSFHRPYAALLLPVEERRDPAAEQALLAAGEWLAHHGGFAVWLAGAGARAGDRAPTVAVRLPDHVAVLTGTDPDPGDARLRLPARPGRPATGSKAEQALEAALANEPWAAGRVWNRTFHTDPLSVPIRVDLMWPAERCAVEIDGAEHRGPLHYEADRRRDVQLQLAGYAVLRFTNQQVLSDLAAVLAQIERFLTTRRSGKDGHAR